MLTEAETGAARARRLLAEIRADHQILTLRAEEMWRAASDPAELAASSDRLAALALALSRSVRDSWSRMRPGGAGRGCGLQQRRAHPRGPSVVCTLIPPQTLTRRLVHASTSAGTSSHHAAPLRTVLQVTPLLRLWKTPTLVPA